MTSQHKVERVDLLPLIEKLEGAKEGSRELDAEIALAIAGWTFEKRGSERKAWWRGPDQTWASTYNNNPPHFTRSMDAAISLVEMKLPGYSPGVSQNGRCAGNAENKGEVEMATTVFKSGASTSSATPARLNTSQIQRLCGSPIGYQRLYFREWRENDAEPVPTKSRHSPEVGSPYVHGNHLEPRP